MDLLASLHLDELPEQQTRTSHLELKLTDDPDIRLGFNACCHCASRSVLVECRACRRVKYCSFDCSKRDASSVSAENDEDTTSFGHSSVICSLLRLCEADEHAEAEECSRDQDAAQRVQSERESYPATLSNILLDGPCYQQVLSSLGRKESKELVIHVVGASEEAELWGQKPNQMKEVFDAYGEALTDLAEHRKLRQIRLLFIGPDCPDNDLCEKRRLDLSIVQEVENGEMSSVELIAETRHGYYSRALFNGGALPNAHVVVFFNPGFTCPDYDWDEALSCIPRDTAFLITTNTEIEGIADCQHLLERGHIASLPPVVAELVGKSDLSDPDSVMFFGENPFVGSRVRQSGTMANDVFVKNRWMFGGTFLRPQPKKRVHRGPVFNGEGEPVAKQIDPNRAAKKRKKQVSGNTKKKNPALI